MNVCTMGALAIRWAIVVTALAIAAAAWPLYTQSRRELAPVEDQSHISMFFDARPTRPSKPSTPPREKS
jgi:multidrug efflux pump